MENKSKVQEYLEKESRLREEIISLKQKILQMGIKKDLENKKRLEKQLEEKKLDSRQTRKKLDQLFLDRKKDYLKQKLKPIEIKERSVSDLMHAMADTGFQGRQLGQAADVFEKMIKDKDTTIILGYAGSLSTTGQWTIIKWLIENHYIDALVSTGANVTEDIHDAMGYGYYKGSHIVDDYELLNCKIDRYYDVFSDETEYRHMEGLLMDFMKSLDDKTVLSSAEFLHLFGKFQEKRKIDSITTAAYREKIPVFSPGMADSGFGVAAAELYNSTGKIPIVNQFKDFVQLGEIGERAKSTSVFYIGGGVPKDTIQLISVIVDLSRGGDIIYPHKYAIQITTDSPQWGSLSGCSFEEAISWGKIDKDAQRAFCHCDATIALPIIAQSISERVKETRKGQNLSFVFDEIEGRKMEKKQVKDSTPLKM